MPDTTGSMEDTQQKDLKKLFPGRSEQIDTLLGLMGKVCMTIAVMFNCTHVVLAT